MMCLRASSHASPHSMRHWIQNAPHPPITRVSCFTLGVFFTDRYPSYRHLCQAAPSMRGIASRGPLLACEITSIDVFGAAPDEALQKPELEWLGLQWPSSLGPLLRRPGRPARHPRARHRVPRRTAGLRLSFGLCGSALGGPLSFAGTRANSEVAPIPAIGRATTGRPSWSSTRCRAWWVSGCSGSPWATRT